MQLARIASPRIVLCAITAFFVTACSVRAEQTFESQRHTFRLVKVVGELTHPWGLVFLPDGRMLVTERGGELRIVSATGALDPNPVEGVPPVAARGQGGLLDVALHPEFDDNQLVYLSYAAAGAGGLGTEVARARLNATRLENVEVIFRAEPKSSGGRHFGSRLLFTPDGSLLVTLGDRGDRPQAQDLDSHPGSIVRIDPDGRVPPDNPFIGRANARPEIYTYGNRNVQGITLDRAGGRVFASEHGPQGGDEVNLIQAGINYGWPVITYGANYGLGTKIGEGHTKSGMAQPIQQWTPSIAPSGLAYYAGDKFPRWRGNIFAGALKYQLLARLELDGDRVIHEERLLEGEIGRIRDVRVGPEGFIYLLTDESDGAIYRLAPTTDG